MKKIMLTLAMLTISTFSLAADKTVNLDDVSIPGFTVKGRIQDWRFTKICIEGQVYILVNGISGPNGISASFKDGKPEQCTSAKK